MDAKKKGWMQKQGGRDVRRVCNDGWMDGWMDGWLNPCMQGRSRRGGRRDWEWGGETGRSEWGGPSGEDRVGRQARGMEVWKEGWHGDF